VTRRTPFCRLFFFPSDRSLPYIAAHLPRSALVHPRARGFERFNTAMREYIPNRAKSRLLPPVCNDSLRQRGFELLVSITGTGTRPSAFTTTINCSSRSDAPSKTNGSMPFPILLFPCRFFSRVKTIGGNFWRGQKKSYPSCRHVSDPPALPGLPSELLANVVLKLYLQSRRGRAYFKGYQDPSHPSFWTISITSPEPGLFADPTTRQNSSQ